MYDRPVTGQADVMSKPSKAAIAKRIREAGERAAAEAEARRAQAHTESMAKELGGPKGPEPTRFGDWEKKGITSDF
jgi:hypothetical protein